MKKLTVILLILMTLVFNIFITTTAFAENMFKEGTYSISDFNFSKDSLYYIQNVSNDRAYAIVFDEELIATQVLYLTPKSPKYNLVPLTDKHRIVIVGDGQVYIDKWTQ